MLELPQTNVDTNLKLDIIYRALQKLDSTTIEHPPNSSSPLARYRGTLRHGLMGLLGQVSIPNNQTWEDAIQYALAVINSPEDTLQRANGPWVRSCSDICKELMTRFGPGVLEAARAGCSKIISDIYHGQRSHISHVNKRASFERYWRKLALGDMFYPASSPLAIGCYESATLCCAFVTSAWMRTPQSAVRAGFISHLACCEDYSHFTVSDDGVRIRMIGLAVGTAYEIGGRAVSALLDSSCLEAEGTGSEVTVEAAVAWRAVGGACTPYSAYIWGDDTLEHGLVGGKVMMGIHDLFDWRNDTAAGNYQNGVSAAYGMGYEEDPFHTYTEEILKQAALHPLSGAYAIGGILFMQFTAARYGSYEYHNTTLRSPTPCLKCIQLLQDITAGAGLVWEPKCPPKNFDEGEKMRELAKHWMDSDEDHGFVQEAVSWFQYLISTGEIKQFDLFVGTVDQVDPDTDWV